LHSVCAALRVGYVWRGWQCPGQCVGRGAVSGEAWDCLGTALELPWNWSLGARLMRTCHCCILPNAWRTSRTWLAICDACAARRSMKLWLHVLRVETPAQGSLRAACSCVGIGCRCISWSRELKHVFAQRVREDTACPMTMCSL
jgi:hypothetical protein